MPTLSYRIPRPPRTAPTGLARRSTLIAALGSLLLGGTALLTLLSIPGHQFLVPLTLREVIDQRTDLFYTAQFLLGLIYLSSLHGIAAHNRRTLWQTTFLASLHALLNLLISIDECRNLFGRLPKGWVHDPTPPTFWIIGSYVLLLTLTLLTAATTTLRTLTAGPTNRPRP